ncbi:MAG: bifunctional hydroxymethylpyrimidine kinase/phosphomethylpyrimidine kinase [Cyanobacteriota bacterium]|nr:bifunctional hydroxymethylpyrimidine kinase/phosphomethylpyrimidine kinase [Cyanobacteriota bacterium]
MANLQSRIPVALTIAGSDSGGGAGIQADLRTFAFHCVHGTSALTCVTAQNTLGVNRVDALLPEAVSAQIAAVAEDIGVQATKTGMLLNAGIIRQVANQVEQYSLQPLVVDPVMVSRTGAQLIDDRAISALRKDLFPLATLITPNRYEAEILTGSKIETLDQMYKAAEEIYHQLQVPAVLIKGGSLEASSRGIDVYFDGQQQQILQTLMIETPHTHGTGCTLSAAIAANLAKGQDLFAAIGEAKDYVTQALQFSLAIGQGQGPVGHFFPLLSSNSLTSDSVH